MLHVSLSQVTARSDDRKIAAVGVADVSAEYWPLLQRRAVFKSVRMREVNIELERDRSGKLNIQHSSSGEHDVGAVAIEHVSFAKLNFRYTNRQVEKYFLATDCTVEDDDLRLNAGRSSDVLKNILLSARVVCKEMRNERFVGNAVEFVAAGKDGKIKFAPFDLQMMGGKGSAKIDGDFSGDAPSYQVHYEISQLQVSEFFKSIAPNKKGTGRLDFSCDLALHGFNSTDLIRTAKGEASLRGKDIDLAIGDLDDKLQRFKSTQSFDLIDIGAFLIAGPIGPAVTKGAEFAAALENSEGNTHVSSFVSQWKVDRGIAHAVDVAMTTKENTIAMRGDLDFPKKEYEGVTIAVLDNSGCARVEQKVSGSFAKPDMEKPDVLKSLTGPLRHVVEKVKDMAGEKCEAFNVATDTAEK